MRTETQWSSLEGRLQRKDSIHSERKTRREWPDSDYHLSHEKSTPSYWLSTDSCSIWIDWVGTAALMRSSPEIYHGEEPASSDDDVRDDIAHIGQEKKMDHSPRTTLWIRYSRRENKREKELLLANQGTPWPRGEEGVCLPALSRERGHPFIQGMPLGNWGGDQKSGMQLNSSRRRGSIYLNWPELLKARSGY